MRGNPSIDPSEELVMSGRPWLRASSSCPTFQHIFHLTSTMDLNINRNITAIEKLYQSLSAQWSLIVVHWGFGLLVIVSALA